MNDIDAKFSVMKIINENKATDEVARIKRLNKKHAKEKGWGWFVHPKGIYTNTNAGNVEYNNAVFNSAMGSNSEANNGSSESGASQAVAEDLKTDFDVDRYIKKKFQKYLVSYPPEGPSYITRQGKFLDISDLAYKMGDDYPEDFPSHGAIQTIMMLDGVAEKPGQLDDGSPILREEGFIRLNDIEEENNYIELSKVKPTPEQYDALLIWLDDNERSYSNINVCTEQFKDFVNYKYSDYTTDEIIDKIKRYYSSGNLYESNILSNNSNKRKNMKTIKENYQYECYFRDKYVGTVEAKDEEEAYTKMEQRWPELPYGEYDGIAEVIRAEENKLDESNVESGRYYRSPEPDLMLDGESFYKPGDFYTVYVRDYAPGELDWTHRRPYGSFIEPNYLTSGNAESKAMDFGTSLKTLAGLYNLFAIDANKFIQNGELKRANKIFDYIKDKPVIIKYVDKNGNFARSLSFTDKYLDNLIEISKSPDFTYDTLSDLYHNFNEGKVLKRLDEKLIQSDSDEAFKKNVQTELDAGKPRKQALAIAYSVKEKNRMNKGLNEEKEMSNYYIVWNHFDPDDLEFVKDEFDQIEDYYGEDYNIEEIEDFKPGLYFISHNDEDATILHTGCLNEEEFYKKLKEELDKLDFNQESIKLPILGWEIDFDVEDIDNTPEAIIDYVKDMIANSYVDMDSMSAYDLIELSDKDFSPIGDEEDESDDYEEDDQEMEEIDLDVKDILDKRDEEDSIYLKMEDFPGADPKEKFHINLMDDDGVERHYTMYFDGIASYSDEHPEFETYPVRFKLLFYNEKLDEAVDNNKIISEIKSAIRDYYSEFDDEDYKDFIEDYLYVEVKDVNNKQTKVEVRAELGYDEFNDLIDEKLDNIIQKYDKDAYFEMEDAGIANAFIQKK